MRLMVIALCCVVLLTSAGGSYANKTQDFLRKNHHSWLPYCLPYEGSMVQVKQVCELGMDKLDAAAKTGSLDNIKAAVGGVGGTCKGCHDDYRAEKFSN
jgi:hypothetical protein